MPEQKPSPALNRLDIHTFPLTGQSLIEASAGTGKTYTINQLYRRAVLGHGLPARLSCTDILVVTFTKAATEELRGRIRAGLRDAFENVLAGEDGEIPDADIRRWISELNSTEDEKTTVRELQTWLQLNLAQMDEASIFTIHKFCAQMLKRYAFDSGVGFNQALEVEGDEYLRRACEDVWRRECYPKGRERVEFITNRFSGPAALFTYYRSWMNKPSIRTKPEIKTSFDELWDTFHQTYEDAKNLWVLLGADNIEKTITSVDIDKKSYSKRNLPNWMNQSGGYLLSGNALAIPDNLYRLGTAMLSEKTNSGEPPKHKLFDLIDQLIQLYDQLLQLSELAWFDNIYQQYISLLEQASVMTSDDLLRLLDKALQSEQGEALAKQIRSLYPIAMIDEFQDTDPTQYRIFSRIYPEQSSEKQSIAGSSEDNTPSGLIMIGDPKQAIYAFRGADIFTYMEAGKTIPSERRFTLDTNYRSDSRLIHAVNAIWQHHTNPFVFDKAIQFYPVQAGGQHDKKAPVWQCQPLNDQPFPNQALQLWTSQEEESRDQATMRVADECATQISALLAGAARFPEGGKKTRAVDAGDIAVLVYSRTQAKIIRDALTRQGVGSVYLTRDSVLDSPEATDLLAMLDAIAHPGNEMHVRRALATSTWGMTAQQLVAMQQDEALWESQLSSMHQYHLIWQRRGIMAMLMQWLEEDERAVKLRKKEDGERILTNILHLGEMLQAQSRKLRGHQALIRWFSERLSADSERGEEAQLRLETDSRLVNIVTIHKSKGLEYPFVFLPYLWLDSAKPKSRSTEVIYYDGRSLVRDLDPGENEKALQSRDTLAEQMRLLYVALTRAKFGCYIWLANVQVGPKKDRRPLWTDSALGELLMAGNGYSPELLAQISIDGTYIGELPEWRIAGQSELAVPPPPVSTAENTARWRDHWRVGSYSQLAAHSSSHTLSSASNNTELAATELGHYFDWEAGMATPGVQDKSHLPQELPLPLTFPKGANPGTCLHAIFEHWDFQDREALLLICEQQLTLYGLQEQPVEKVADWIASIVQQPLALYDTQATLDQIEPTSRLDEMEFYLPVGNLTAFEIDSLLGGDNRFSFEPLTGYLKGFIDLIFEWQGRYYVADYKSNYLGDEWRDYVPSALRESMRNHRYDLQSWIYMLALDQLLSRRLPDYQPQKHLGGSVYFYLRGMGDHFTKNDHNTDPDAGVCFTPVNVEVLRQWRRSVLPDTEHEGGS